MYVDSLKAGYTIKVTGMIPGFINLIDDGRETAKKEINICRGAVITLLSKSDSISEDSYCLFAIDGFSSHQLQLKVKFRDLEADVYKC